MAGVNESGCVVTVSWSEPVISCNASITQYVLTVSPPTTECPSGSCVVGRREGRFETREQNISLSLEQIYIFIVRAYTCNNTLTGKDSDQYAIRMEGNEMICNYMYQKERGNTTAYLSSFSYVATPESCEYYYIFSGSIINITWKTINVSEFCSYFYNIKNNCVILFLSVVLF